MTKYCDACHTPNRDRAKFCRGCAGKFSGIRFDAAAFVATMPDTRTGSRRRKRRRVNSRPAPAVDLDPRRSIRSRRPPGIDISLVLLLIFLLLAAAAFVYWHSETRHCSGEAAGSSPPMLAPSFRVDAGCARDSAAGRNDCGHDAPPAAEPSLAGQPQAEVPTEVATPEESAQPSRVQEVRAEEVRAPEVGCPRGEIRP